MILHYNHLCTKFINNLAYRLAHALSATTMDVARVTLFSGSYAVDNPTITQWDLSSGTSERSNYGHYVSRSNTARLMPCLTLITVKHSVPKYISIA